MEYRKVKLKEIANINMGQSPKGCSYNNQKMGMPFLQGNRTFGRIYPNIDTWTTEPNKIGKKNSILMSVRAPVGDLNIANQNVCIGRGLCSIEMKNKNNKYLYYLLINSINEIKKKSTGTVFDSINRKELEEIKVIDFDEKQQNRIVNILFSIDQKIELNNQINDNLYNISKNIFRNFYNNNTGKWQACKINDIGLYISDYVANGSFKSLAENVKIYDDKNYALFIRNTDLKVNFTQGRKYVDEHSYNFLNKSKLYGRELIISNVGDVGSIFLCPAFDIPMTLGNNVIMVDSKDTEVNYNYYLYYFFLSVEGQYLIDGITGGSAQPKFNKTDFRNSQIELPSKEEIMNFNNKVIPMYNIIEKNIKENETLEQIRDTLLPKLMNGEIDLHKIEI